MAVGNTREQRAKAKAEGKSLFAAAFETDKGRSKMSGLMPNSVANKTCHLLILIYTGAIPEAEIAALIERHG